MKPDGKPRHKGKPLTKMSQATLSTVLDIKLSEMHSACRVLTTEVANVLQMVRDNTEDQENKP